MASRPKSNPPDAGPFPEALKTRRASASPQAVAPAALTATAACRGPSRKKVRESSVAEPFPASDPSASGAASHVTRSEAPDSRLTEEPYCLAVSRIHPVRIAPRFTSEGSGASQPSHENASRDAFTLASQAWDHRTRATTNTAPAFTSRVRISPARNGSVSSETGTNNVGHQRSYA